MDPRILRYRWGYLATALGIGFLMTAYLPLEAVLVTQGIDDTTIHQAFVCYSAAQIVGFLVLGLLSDVVPLRIPLVIAMGIGLVSAIMTMQGSAAWIIASRILAGFAAGVLPSVYTAASRVTTPLGRTKEVGFVVMQFTVGGSFGILWTSVLIAEGFGSTLFIGAMESVVLAAGLVLVATMPRLRFVGQEHHAPFTAASIVHNRSLIVLLILAFFSAGACNSYLMFQTDFIRRNTQMTFAVWEIFGMIQSIVGFVLTVVSEKTRFGPKDEPRALRLALLAALISFLGPAIHEELLLFSMLGSALAMGFIDLYWTSLVSKATPSSLRGRVMAGAFLITSTGRFVVASALSPINLPYGFVACAVVCAIAIAFTLGLRRFAPTR